MSFRSLSRKDFLKLAGASGIALFLSSAGLLSINGTRKNDPVHRATAQSAGSWVLGQDTTTIAIHASYLHNGFILYIAGSGYHASHLDGPFEARLLDPETGLETVVPLSSDLFCHGSTFLSNGNILIAGGTLRYDTSPDNCNGRWHGLNEAYEFDVDSGQLVQVQSMAAGRWYPTLVTLANGKVPTFNGTDDFGVQNRLVEIYNDATKNWSIKYDPSSSTGYCIGEGFSATCPGAGSQCFGGTAGNGVSPINNLYPRMHLMPNGLIAVVGMYPQIRSFDPSTGIFTLLNSSSIYRHYGSSVLLPLQNISSEKGKVLLAGGSSTISAAATDVVEIIDFNASSSNFPVVRAVQSLQYARKFTLPVILPDGKIIFFGGSSQGASAANAVNYPEMFDPLSESWTVLPQASVPRTYHGVALLLYDGRVWVAGSTPSRSTQEFRTEIFRPWYYSETRPSISSSPVVEGYGGTITISAPDAVDITAVSLVRLMSTTHHFEANQRFLWLQVLDKTSDSVIVAAPLNGDLAPPGYYMIHVLNGAGVPSTAKIVKIPGDSGGDATPPIQVSGLAVLPSGPSQLDLSWNANPESDLDHYNVHRDTVAGFTPDSGNRIAQPTSASYSDAGLASSTTYYYVVAAVDTTGNVGPASSEVAGTTEPTSGSETFYDVAYPGNTVGSLYSGGNTRFGEEARISTSVLVGKSLSKWTVYLRRVGSASGTVSAVIRRSSDDGVVATFDQTLSAAGLPTSFSPFDFTLSSPYVIQTGNRLLIQYSGTSRVELSVWSVDKIDGDRTRRTRYSGTYAIANAQDVVGSMSGGPSGGDTTPPIQVSGLAVLPSGPSQLDLSWNANPESDLDHYNVHRDTSSGFIPTAANRIAQTTSASYSDTGLASSTTYYYVVSAEDATGNVGPVSSEVAGTTEPTSGSETFYDVAYPGNTVGSLYSGGNTRFGEEARISTSVLVGKSLKYWKVYLRRIGTAAGDITATIRRSSDDTVVAAFNETIAASSLPSAFVEQTFSMTTPHILQAGDRILVEYSGTSRVELSVWNVDKIDGDRTRRTRYSGTTYAIANAQDVVGTMSPEELG